VSLLEENDSVDRNAAALFGLHDEWIMAAESKKRIGNGGSVWRQ